MTLFRWYIAKGPDGALQYLTSIQPDGMLPTWSDDSAKAARFESRDMAHAFARMLAGQGVEVMTIAADPKAEQQRAAQAQHRASDLDYVRRAMTARDVRCGPGPERPVVHEPFTCQIEWQR